MQVVPQRLVGEFFGVGSVGARDYTAPLDYITDLAVPYWYQLPRFKEEDMVRQFAYLIDGFEEEEDFTLDVDMYTYSEIMQDDSPLIPDNKHAHGLHLLRSRGPFVDFKTQQTAPATMAFTIRGPDGGQLLSKSMISFFASLMARVAAGQVEFLESFCDNIILCQDDPALGHTINMIQSNRIGGLEVGELARATESVYPKGAIPAYHYCDDWRRLRFGDNYFLWDSKARLIHIDVLHYPPHLESEQSEAINHFIERGGGFALGVIPNNEEAFFDSVIELLRRGLQSTFQGFTDSGVSIELITENSMVSTQCGLSGLSDALTERIHAESRKFDGVFKEVKDSFLTR